MFLALTMMIMMMIIMIMVTVMIVIMMVTGGDGGVSWIENDHGAVTVG